MDLTEEMRKKIKTEPSIGWYIQRISSIEMGINGGSITIAIQSFFQAIKSLEEKIKNREKYALCWVNIPMVETVHEDIKASDIWELIDSITKKLYQKYEKIRNIQ